MHICRSNVDYVFNLGKKDTSITAMTKVYDVDKVFFLYPIVKEGIPGCCTLFKISFCFCESSFSLLIDCGKNNVISV